MLEKRLQLNNKGASLATVIVIVSFLTIISTTMLYITSVNYQSKQVDYANKHSFYEAETALDCFKAIVTADSQAAYENAYMTVMSQYASNQAAGDDVRRSIFTKAYIEYLEQIWTQRITDAGEGKMEGAIKALLNSYHVDSALVNCFLDFSMVESGEEAAGFVSDINKGTFILKNIRVRNIEKGYATYVYTCIACNVPEIDWTFTQYQTWSESMNASQAVDWKQVDLEDYIIYVNWKKY